MILGIPPANVYIKYLLTLPSLGFFKHTKQNNKKSKIIMIKIL